MHKLKLLRKQIFQDKSLSCSKEDFESVQQVRNIQQNHVPTTVCVKASNETLTEIRSSALRQFLPLTNTRNAALKYVDTKLTAGV